MHPESENTEEKQKTARWLTDAVFYLAILFFIIGFNFSDHMVGNWYQQFMPNLPNMQVSDITFLDSLTGFAVTGNSSPNDSSGYILKTTNGGDNWVLKFAEFRDFSRVKFINSNTGFVSGGYFNGARIYKTTNAGENWFPNNIPGGGQIFFNDMQVISEDTIWVVAENSLVGGVFFTSTGGSNWQQQLNLGSQNPDHLYMYNGRIGFISKANSYLRRTSDSGLNWNIVPNDNGFRDMYFVDSLKGWKCGTTIDSIKATSNGGISWFKQLLPPTGGFFNVSTIIDFAFVNKDTIYGAGPRAGITLGFRGMLYKTTNGGQNWGYQLPDTNTITISSYSFIDFYNKNIGWAYSTGPGIHTTNGGDTTFYLGIQLTSSNIPKEFELKQNYPNPFNPRTVIPYKLKKAAFVRMIAYEITGKETQVMVNQWQQAGEYEVDFMGKFAVSSGIYFYRMEVTDDRSKKVFSETKKMVLLK